MIDKNTFGDSKAEETLATILDQKQDSKLTRYVARILITLSRHLRQINLQSASKETRQFLYQAMRAHYFEQINTSRKMRDNPDVVSFVKNCGIIRIRNYILRK